MKEIELTQDKVALVSDEDYEWTQQWKWYFHSRGYAMRRRRKIEEPGCERIRMHRVILKRMGVDLSGKETDHINRNKLDNRRENLRAVTHQQNNFNKGKYKNSTSRYKGVSWHRSNQKWKAAIYHNEKCFSLGHYKNEKAAAEAYDIAALHLFGEFAVLNFNDR